MLITNTLSSTLVIPSQPTTCPTNCSCLSTTMTITCTNTIPDAVPDDIVNVVLEKLTELTLTPRRFCDVTWPNVRTLFLAFDAYIYPQKLQEHTFDCLDQIQTLVMRDLHSWMMPTAGMFHGFTNVTTLDVSQNYLLFTTDYKQLFSDRSNFPHLRHLNLSLNRIPLDVDQDFIDSLSSRALELLDFSKEYEITFDFENSRELCQTLQTIILHDSHMITNHLPWNPCDSLQYVDLSGNQDVTQQLKQCDGAYVPLAINMFLVAKTMRLDRVMKVDKGYDISNCRVGINYGYRVRELYFSHNYIPDFQILFDGDWNIDNLEYINLSNNHIKTINPEAFIYLSSLLKIDLSFNNLNEMPDLEDTFESLFRRDENLTSIDLSSNGLSNLPDKSFLSNANLAEIRLSQNSFTQLSLEVSNLHKLKLLDLRYNDIQYLDERSMQKVEFLNNKHQNGLQLGQNNTQLLLLLEGNPFTCKCEAFPFLQWFMTSSIFNSSYTCNVDGRTIPMTQQAVHEASEDCERPMRRRRTIALSTVLPAAAIATIVATVTILYRRHKRRLKQQRFDDTLQLIRDEDTGFLFTVFLSYSSLDREFVIQHIRKPMEVSSLILYTATWIENSCLKISDNPWRLAHLSCIRQSGLKIVGSTYQKTHG